MIRMENLCVASEEQEILSKFNVSVAKGDKVLIKGRSGIGKTTLFRLILGFRIPVSGNIYFQGEKIDPGIAWDIRKKVTHISQNSDIGEGLVRNMIEEIFSYKVNKGMLDTNELHLLLSKLSLSKDILDKRFENLSGGEKQRIVIIISMLTKKTIFLLDEVTSSLDRSLKKTVVEMFLNNPSWTVIAISHDTEWERENVRVIDMERIQEDTNVCC